MWISWTRVTKLFLKKKYFYKHQENQTELKFLELKQENMLVAHYKAKFIALLGFILLQVNTDENKASHLQSVS